MLNPTKKSKIVNARIPSAQDVNQKSPSVGSISNNGTLRSLKQATQCPACILHANYDTAFCVVCGDDAHVHCAQCYPYKCPTCVELCGGCSVSVPQVLLDRFTGVTVEFKTSDRVYAFRMIDMLQDAIGNNSWRAVPLKYRMFAYCSAVREYPELAQHTTVTVPLCERILRLVAQRDEISIIPHAVFDGIAGLFDTILTVAGRMMQTVGENVTQVYNTFVAIFRSIADGFHNAAAFANGAVALGQIVAQAVDFSREVIHHVRANKEKLLAVLELAIKMVVRYLAGYTYAQLALEFAMGLPSIPGLHTFFVGLLAEQHEPVPQGVAEALPRLVATIYHSLVFVYTGSLPTLRDFSQTILSLNAFLPDTVQDLCGQFPKVAKFLNVDLEAEYARQCPGASLLLEYALACKAYSRLDPARLSRMKALYTNYQREMSHASDKARAFWRPRIDSVVPRDMALDFSEPMDRKQPDAYYFFGAPGGGKTTMTDKLLVALLEFSRKHEFVDKETDLPKFRCPINAANKHWDQYTGQPVIVFNDFLQQKETDGTAMGPIFLQTVDTCSMAAPMAAVTRKGMPVAPHLVVASGNIELDRWKDYLLQSNNSNAYLRRVFCSVKVTPRTVSAGAGTFVYSPNDGNPDDQWILEATFAHEGHKQVHELRFMDILKLMCKSVLKYHFAPAPSKVISDATRKFVESFSIPAACQEMDIDYNPFVAHFSTGDRELYIPPEVPPFDGAAPDCRDPWYRRRPTVETVYYSPLAGKAALDTSPVPEQEVPRLADIVSQGTEADMFEDHDLFRDQDGVYRLPTQDELDAAPDVPFGVPRRSWIDSMRSRFLIPAQERLEEFNFKDPRLYFKLFGFSVIFGIIAKCATIVHQRAKVPTGEKDVYQIPKRELPDRPGFRVAHIQWKDSTVPVYVPEDGPALPQVLRLQEDLTLKLRNPFVPDQRELEIIPSLRASVKPITYTYGGLRTCWAFAVNDRCLLMAKHCIRDIMYVEYRKDTTLEINQRNSTRHFQDDVCLVKLLEAVMPGCRSHVSKFCEHPPVEGMLKRIDLDTPGPAQGPTRVTYAGANEVPVYRVSSPGMEGDCGLPYIAAGSSSPDRIVGIHVAGSKATVGTSYVHIVTRNFLSIHNAADFSVVPQEAVSPHGLTVVARSAVRAHPAARSGFIVNPFYRGPPSGYGIARLGMGFDADGNMQRPLDNGLLKWAQARKSANPAGFCMSEDLKAKMLAHWDNIFDCDWNPTFEQTVAANHTYGWKAIDRTKAAGFSFASCPKGVLFKDTEEPILTEEALRALRSLEVEMCGDDALSFPKIVSLKDEKLPLEKVAAYKSRLFASVDVFEFLLARKHFAKFIIGLNKNGRKYGYPCACDPEQIGALMSEFVGKYILSVDIKGQDCSYVPEAWYCFLDVLFASKAGQNIGNVFYVHPRFGPLDITNYIRWRLILHVINDPFVALENAYWMEGILPSGWFLTLLFNIFNSSRMKLLLKEKYPDMHALLFGDDGWFVFDTEEEALEAAKNFAQMGLSLGFIYVDQDKDTTPIYPRTIEDAVFCGRVYHKHPVIGHTAYLQKHRLLKSIEFVRAGGVYTNMRQALDTFLLEAYRMPQPLFEELMDIKIGNYRLGDYACDWHTGGFVVLGQSEHAHDLDTLLSQVMKDDTSPQGLDDLPVHSVVDSSQAQSSQPQEGTTFTTTADVEEATPPGDCVYPDIDSEMLEKLNTPVITETFDWTAADSAGTVIHTCMAMSDYFDEYTAGQYSLSGGAFLRCTVKMHAAISVSPLQSGKLMVTAAPLVGIPPDEYAAASLPHGIITAGSHSTCLLTAPYQRDTTYGSVTSYQTPYSASLFDFLMINFVVLNPLSAVLPSSARIVVAVWFEDIEFVPGAITTFTPSAQGLGDQRQGSSKQKKKSKGKQATTTVGESSNDTAGVLHKITKGLKTLGGAVKEVGTLVTTVTATLAIMGLSKPTAGNNLTLVSTHGDRFFMNYDGVYMGANFGLSALATNVIPQNIFAEGVDPMDLAYICRRKNLLFKTSWNVSDSIGSYLAIVPVTPAAWSVYTVNVANSNSLFVLSQCFRYWSGELHYLIEPVKTAQHHGQLMAAVDHGDTTAMLTTLSRSSMLPRMYWDITNDSAVEVVVPFLGPYLMEETNPKQCDRVVKPTGRTMWLTNTTVLGATAQVPNAIDINVYVWMEKPKFLLPGVNGSIYEPEPRPIGPPLDIVPQGLDPAALCAEFNTLCQKNVLAVKEEYLPLYGELDPSQSGWKALLVVTRGNEFIADSRGAGRTRKDARIQAIQEIFPVLTERYPKVIRDMVAGFLKFCRQQGYMVTTEAGSAGGCQLIVNVGLTVYHIECNSLLTCVQTLAKYPQFATFWDIVPQGKDDLDVKKTGAGVYDSDIPPMVSHVLGPKAYDSPEIQYQYMSADIVHNLRQVTRRFMYRGVEGNPFLLLRLHDYAPVPLFAVFESLFVFVTGGTRYVLYNPISETLSSVMPYSPQFANMAAIPLRQPLRELELPMMGKNHMYAIRGPPRNYAIYSAPTVPGPEYIVYMAMSDDGSYGGIHYAPRYNVTAYTPPDAAYSLL